MYFLCLGLSPRTREVLRIIGPSDRPLDQRRDIEMALKFQGVGVVILPPIEKWTKQGNVYQELVVDFGTKKREDWYVRCFVQGLNFDIQNLEKGQKVSFSGIIVKWPQGSGYGVVLQADDFALLS